MVAPGVRGALMRAAQNRLRTNKRNPVGIKSPAPGLSIDRPRPGMPPKTNIPNVSIDRPKVGTPPKPHSAKVPVKSPQRPPNPTTSPGLTNAHKAYADAVRVGDEWYAKQTTDGGRAAAAKGKWENLAKAAKNVQTEKDGLLRFYHT